MMADHRQHCEGHHQQADVLMPAMPEAGLVVGEPELGLGRLERLLDRPTLALDHRPASLLPGRPSLFGRATAYLGLDPVERGDAGERLHCDRRGGSEIVELPTHMVPAVGQPHRAALGRALVGKPSTCSTPANPER